MVTSRGYVPRRGDIVGLEFDPQAGHEQAGRRPALVISHDAYNGKVGLALFCPITNSAKGYPFEVTITGDGAVTGVVLSDQVRSLDWRARNAKFIARLSHAAFAEVLAKLQTLINDR